MQICFPRGLAIVSAIFLMAACVSAVDSTAEESAGPERFFGIDPNTLSCDPSGLNFLLLPHYTDCNKFFKCNHGSEVEVTCPANLVFDFHLQVCNWDWAADCILRKPDNEIDGSGDYDEGTDEWAAEQIALRPAGDPEISPDAVSPVEALRPLKVEGSAHFKAPLDCKRPGSAEKRIANNEDCQRYWRCVNGEISSFFCTDGLFFNDKSQQCDFEANVVCNVNHEHELQGEFIVYNS